MRNDTIGQVLKKYRKANNLEVADVSRILKEKYGLSIADKTIYGWESNQAHPVADTFVILCEIYHIADVGKEFSLNATPVDSIVTIEEYELLAAYRKLPKAIQKKTLETIKEKGAQISSRKPKNK